MRYKLTIEYDGRNYAGWQRQDNALSVQQVLEEKLSEIFNAKITVTGSGRTDAGVHALGQIAHFDGETTIPCEKIIFPLNNLLPPDIKVKECVPAPEGFHAQYSAKRKTYMYKCYVANVGSPTREKLYAWVLPPVDVSAMREAAKLFIGKHDFKAFSSTGGNVKQNTVREIYRVDIKEDGEEIIFRIEGSGFLYNMVRIMVGTLIYIGKGKLPPSVITKMLETRDRTLGGKTFPPEGLYLEKVEYPQEEKESQENLDKMDDFN